MDDQAVTFAKLVPSNSRFQRLRAELGVDGFGLNLVTLQPGQRGRIHAHEHQEEVYLVLEGALALWIDGTPHTLGRWDVVRVAPHVRRQLGNMSPEPLVLLAMGAAGTHMDTGSDGRAWSSWDDHGPGVPTKDIPVPEDVFVD